MNEALRSVWSRVTAAVGKLTPNQRRNLGIAVILAVFTVGLVTWIMTRPNYVTVMSGLDNKSLGQVQTQLATLHIPNQIVGSSVLVPRGQADTARVQLAMAGLPQSGDISYSSLPNTFGMTQDQFNVQVLGILQQSLNQTIQSIDGIESAQVHIVMPDQQLFVSQPTNSAKASVFVQLAPGVQLGSVQVAGIQQLVSHSVKGLGTSDVAVVDQNGVTLSGDSATTSNPSVTAGNEIATRQQLEDQLRQQLTQGLQQIVGPGNAVVMVHANVTFNQTDTSSHTYVAAPGQTTGLIANQQKTTSTSTNGAGTTSGGAAGQSSTNPGLSTYAGTGSGTGNTGNNATSQTTTNYDNSYTDQHTVGDPIQLNGYTVGVFLNAADTALTPPVQAQIKQFVATAVGRTGNLNNAISVVAVPFQTQSLVPTIAAKSVVPMWVWLAAGALIVLIGGVFILRRRRREGPAVAERTTPVLPFKLEEELENLPSEEQHMKDQLVRLANQRPGEFASLLRTWLLSD